MSRYDLESEIRQLLRAEIRSSPAILKEYRRRHRWDWVPWAGACVIAPLLAVALVMMPLVLTIPLQVPLLTLLVDFGNVTLAHRIPSADAGMLLAGQGMMIAAIGSLTLSHGWTCFCNQKDLFAAAYWPVSDRELNRRNRESWAFNLLCLAYMLALLTVSVALVAHPTPLQLAALIISIPLNAWHLMSLAILWCSAVRTSRTPNVLWMAPAGICYLLVWLAGATGLQPGTYVAGISELLFMVPTGWVNGAVHHLFFEPHPLVIGYVVVLAATWIYAANWLRQGFRIREVQIGADGKITATFESGLLTEAGELAGDKFVQKEQVAVLPSMPIPGDLRARAASLLGHSWEQCGWIERFISSRMTKRERTLVGHLYQGKPRWTRAWLITTIATTVGGAAFVAMFKFAHWLDGKGTPPETLAPMSLLLWIPFLVVVEIFVHVPSIHKQQEISVYRGLHPVFPIGWNELFGTMRKIIWQRLLWLLPQALVLASFDWLVAPRLVGYSYNWAISLVAMLGVGLEASAWLPFCTSAPMRLSLRRLALLFTLSLIAMGWLCGAVAAFFPHPLVAAPAWAVVLLCTLAIRRLARWVYHRVMDFPCREVVLAKGR